jgi:hypothetical protein
MGKFDQIAAWGLAIRGFSEVSGIGAVGAAHPIRSVAVGSSSLFDEATIAAASSVSASGLTRIGGDFQAGLAACIL